MHFFAVSAVLSKWNVILIANVRNTDIGIMSLFMYKVMHWHCIKYQYHFPIELLMHTLTSRILIIIASVYSYTKSG